MRLAVRQQGLFRSECPQHCFPIIISAFIFVDVEQAEQDIESLAIKTSVSFIPLYSSSTSVVIMKAITSLVDLMVKFNNIGNDNPDGIYSTRLLSSFARLPRFFYSYELMQDSPVRGAH